MNKFSINGRLIGEGETCYIIAEAGINHNGDLEIAKKMIDVAVESGADAIKFQTFTAEEFVRDKKQTYEYVSRGKKKRESMLKMFKRHEFTKGEWEKIRQYCKHNEITFFSSPQNFSDLQLLLELGIPAIKVGSDDLTNLPLLEKYARQDLPMIISTGMGYMSEIDEAVRKIKKFNDELALLYCVSTYPARYEELNLRAIKTLNSIYPDLVSGFSDHTLGTEAAMAAAALGIKIYEKHFTLDHTMEGPDHSFSANPDQLKKIVSGIHNIEKAMGTSKIQPGRRELQNRRQFRRSIVAADVIKKGQRINENNLTFMKPGTGISPGAIEYITGRKVDRDIDKHEIIKLEDLD